MESRCTQHRWLPPLAGLLLACVVAPAGAQDVRFYRSIDKNGRVTFSDRPPTNARYVDTITVPTGPISSGVPESTQQQRNEARQQLQVDASARAQGLADANQQIRTAHAALNAAKAAQVAGKEPLPGERIGTVSGFSRLREEYWDRQNQLQSAVENAQRELQAAISQRNRLR
ncbi:MAG: DUF4124 domain-containing protein [Burkholderiales bacterium]